MKRWLVLIALAVAGLLLLRNEIAMMLFRQVIAKQVSTDIVAEHAAGVHVASCGSGTPLPDLTLAGGCTAVIAAGRLFVFDVGEGAPETLARMGLRPARIEAVFLTHFHSDHVAGLGALALQRNLGEGVSTALPVYGADGVAQVTRGFDAAFAQDHAYRLAHHHTLTTPPQALQLDPRAFAPPTEGYFPVVYERDGVSIRAFSVPHGPVKPAVGYRLEHDGMRVVISGDTMSSTNLVAAADDADLLIHEALAPRMVAEIEKAARAAGQETLATVMHDIPNYHATPVQAAEAARAAGVRALAFTHMIPPLPRRLLEGPFLEGVSQVYDGPVYVLRDGTLLSLDAGAAPEERSLL